MTLDAYIRAKIQAILADWRWLGRRQWPHCPIHQDEQDLAPLLNEPETNLPAMLEAPKKQTPINLILRAKEIQAAQGITFGEALTEAQAMA